MTKLVVGVAILFLILLLALIGSYIYTFITPAYEIADKYEVFRDLLTIILAIAGVSIAAGGYLGYRYVSAVFRRDVDSAIEQARALARMDTHRVNAYVFASTGYAFWHTYDAMKQASFLEEAIRFTETAYTHHAAKLDEQQPENQRLICDIRNNLGYYLAERKKPEDKALARDCAEYIIRKIPTYPDASQTWQGTYNFIMQQYP